MAISTQPVRENFISENCAEIKPALNQWTSVRIKKIALALFSLLSITAASLLIGYSLSGRIVSNWGLLSIPLVILAGGAIYWATRMKDYENAQELDQMRQEAAFMPFSQLYEEHGIFNLCRYEILTLSELQRKFNRQIQTMNYRTVATKYNLNELLEKGITTQAHIELLRHLVQQSDQYERAYYEEARQIDHLYPNRTGVIQKHIRGAKQTIDSAVLLTAHPHNSQKKINTYLATSAATTGMAFIGDRIAESTGRREQEGYDRAMAEARGRWSSKLSPLENRYSAFKRSLRM